MLSVRPGSGAEEAGVVPGDLITGFDGRGHLDEEDRGSLSGPVGTSITLSIDGPLGAAPRAVTVERRLLPPAAPRARMAPELARLREAAGKRGRRAVVRATRVARESGAADDPAVLLAPLRMAERHRQAAGIAMAGELEDIDDWRIQRELAGVYHRAGQPERSLDFARRSEAGRVPDLVVAETSVDLGGGERLREAVASDLWALGERDGAIEVGRTLSATRDLPELWATLGMASQRTEPEIWRVDLPPAAPLELTLIDGSRWSSADHERDVVLLTFWATWCPPCIKELPELAKMARARHDAGLRVIAISLDAPAAEDAVTSTVDRLELPFPVAHAPEVARRFGIVSLPTLEVWGRGGVIAHKGRGYSPQGMQRLDTIVTRALEAPAGSGTPMAEAFVTEASESMSAGPVSADSGSRARLRDFVPFTGAHGLATFDGGVVLGVREGSPAVWRPEDGGVTPEYSLGEAGPSELVTWAAGPVAANRRRLTLRAWSPDGAPRWMLTVPSPILHISGSQDVLWMALREEVLALGHDGALLTRAPLRLDALAAAGDGTAWGLADGRRVRLMLSAETTEAALTIADAGPAPGGKHIAEDGTIGGPPVADLVVGRFGPSGETRVVVLRRDRAVLGVSASPSVEARWLLTLTQGGHIGALDVDGDGRDELLIAVDREGVAIAELVIP